MMLIAILIAALIVTSREYGKLTERCEPCMALTKKDIP